MGFVANLERLYTMTFDIYRSRKQIRVCVSPKFPTNVEDAEDSAAS